MRPFREATGAVALATVLFALLLLPGGGRARADEAECGLVRTIVLLRADVDPDAAAETLARRYRGVVCRVYRHSIRGVTLRCTGPGVARVLAQDPLVVAVEPDVRVRALEQATPTGVRRVGATPPSSSERRPGPVYEVGVAVLDTGIDLGHPDLRVVGGASFVEGAPSAQDGEGHGTHIAGVIAARDDDQGVVGIAPGTRLFALKVLDDAGSGNLSDVIAGLEWVTKNADRVAVANLSLGVHGRSPSFRAAIRAAVRAGVVVVAAAGNEGGDVFGPDGVFDTDDDALPAAFPEVCAVSALADSDGRPGGLGPETKHGPDDTLARFSNYARAGHERPLVRSPGGAIDVAAPGSDILSCWKDGGYRRASGTSMAAPHVSGIVARLVAARGRDFNRDGTIDGADVAAIRQAVIDLAEPQRRWRPDGSAGDRDALPEGLASLVPAALARAAAVPAAPASASPLEAVPGVRVFALISPSGPLATTEAPSVLVGVENRGSSAQLFDLVLLDRESGRGLGARRLLALAPGAHATVAFPCAALAAARPLRAVVLPPQGASAAPP